MEIIKLTPMELLQEYETVRTSITPDTFLGYLSSFEGAIDIFSSESEYNNDSYDEVDIDNDTNYISDTELNYDNEIDDNSNCGEEPYKMTDELEDIDEYHEEEDLEEDIDFQIAQMTIEEKEHLPNPNLHDKVTLPIVEPKIKPELRISRTSIISEENHIDNTEKKLSIPKVDIVKDESHDLKKLQERVDRLKQNLEHSNVQVVVNQSEVNSKNISIEDFVKQMGGDIPLSTLQKYYSQKEIDMAIKNVEIIVYKNIKKGCNYVCV